MCIILVTTAHPIYPFILIGNRDEHLARPTADAGYWAPPLSHVLGGRDLERAAQGTWLGMTMQGRIAALTNYRDEAASDQQLVQGIRSRGVLPLAWLTVSAGSAETADEFARRMIEDEGVQDIGGFSLLFGQLKRRTVGPGSRPLGIMSNRTPDVEGIIWPGKPVFVQSNTRFDTEDGGGLWPKVVLGEAKLAEIMAGVTKNDHTAEDKEELIRKLFELLSTNTYPELPPDRPATEYGHALRRTIFVPVTNRIDNPQQPASMYGTQKETIILVDWNGHTTFAERTVVDSEGKPLMDENGQVGHTRRFEFDIQGWND